MSQRQEGAISKADFPHGCLGPSSLGLSVRPSDTISMTAASIPVAGIIGTVFGLFIGILGGRRFFISIVCGAVLGAALFGLVSTGCRPWARESAAP